MTQQEEYRLAKKYGFKCHLDPRRGGDWAKFSKGNLHIWLVLVLGKLSWQTAYAVGNNYIGHGIVDNLEEAFKKGDNLKTIIFENRGGEEINARYYAQHQSWEFTIEYHRVAQKWYQEAIFGGREQLHHYYDEKDGLYAKTLNEALAKMVKFFNVNFKGNYSVDIEREPNSIQFIKNSSKISECSCGAKHTQNPNFHLDWCDLKKK